METLNTVLWVLVLLLTFLVVKIKHKTIFLGIGNTLASSRLRTSLHSRSGTDKKAEDPAKADKLLYHHLQNANYDPDALARAQDRLIELFDLTIFKALESSEPTILSIKDFDGPALSTFLEHSDSRTAAAWTSYLARRSKGGARELLPTQEYSKHWIRLSTPIKYVDGAWLGRIHHTDTPLQYRPFTRIAWQIMSEELGDGDLSKNHVHLYYKLLNSVGVNIGLGDSEQFIDSSVNPNDDERVWAAAIAQLTIGLFPGEFLPEILGFNLAYEAVTIETLVCIHELKELNLDPSYFNLHVTIDNSDSGHSAMALYAVTGFMNSIKDKNEVELLWRRVQAGFILAKGLPSTSRPLSVADMQLLDIISRKCTCARPAHQCCQARIGGHKGMKLGDWLDPQFWDARKHDFLQALASSRWIVRGNPNKSRLLGEVKWGGRMFGAFTSRETLVLEKWIRELEPNDFEQEVKQAKGTYRAFTAYNPTCPKVESPIHHSSIDWPGHSGPVDFHITISNFSVQICEFWKLLIVVASPFQYFIASSAKSATPRGMAVLRILRTLNGFPEADNTVAGMDEVRAPPRKGIVEIGLELRSMMVKDDTRIEALGPEWRWLHDTALAPDANFWFLAGVQFAFAALLLRNDTVSMVEGLTQTIVTDLKDMGAKVEQELLQLKFDQNEDSRRGFWIASCCIQKK